MGIATKIPQSAFNGLQLDAGVLLTSFDPTNPAVPDSAIICATTGGINVVCTPTFSDFGEDVDNVPANMMEFKHLDSWECSMSTTGLGTSVSNIKLALGVADISSNKVTPRMSLSQSDFIPYIWWVGDRADGGLVAVKMLNALSTGGFSLQTTKNGKGQVSITITGHVSISAQNTVPMEFYSIDSGSATTYTYTAVESPSSSANPATSGWYVLVGDNYYPTTDTTVDSNVTYYTRSANT